MFSSETDKLHQRVQKVILRKKNLYRPWVDSASLSQYGPEWLFVLVMVLSTETPITIAMSNPPQHFLFVVCLLEVERTWSYSVHTT
jgi:hypothetical protein